MMAENIVPAPVDDDETPESERGATLPAVQIGATCNEDLIGSNVAIFRDYLANTIKVADLVAHYSPFTREQKRKLLDKTDSIDAARQALEIIEQIDNDQKYTCLVHALEQADYPKLVDLLKGKLYPANDDNRRRFNDCTAEMYRRMNPVEVLPHLLQKCVISTDEATEIRNINASKSRGHAVLHLLYILPNRQRYWYDWTIFALVKSNQVELAKAIDPDKTDFCLKSDEMPSENNWSVSLRSMQVADDATLQQRAKPKSTEPSNAVSNGDVIIDCLETKIGKLMAGKREALDKLWKSEGDCKKKIETMCNNLHMKIDEMKAKELRHLNNHAVEIDERIDSQNKSLIKALSSLTINSQNQAEAKSHIPVYYRQSSLTKERREAESAYQRALEDNFIPSLVFQENKKLCELLFQPLGTINVEEATRPDLFDEDNIARHDPRNNEHLLKDTGEVAKSGAAIVKQTNQGSMPNDVFTDRRIPTDVREERHESLITAIEFMPNGNAVLCDRFNNKLKLLDRMFNIVDCIVLPAGPHDVAVIDGKKVIVTLPMKHQLLYVDILPKVTADQPIQLDKRCWGIEMYNNELYVTIHYGYSSDRGEVCILDLNGALKRRLRISENGVPASLCCPFYLKVNPVSQRLYISDFGWPMAIPPTPSTLYCLRLGGEGVHIDEDRRYSHGNVLYAYQTSNWLGGGAIYVDEMDNVLVSGQYSNNILLVTRDGVANALTIPQKDNISQPWSVAVRKEDNKLFVGCWGCGDLLELGFNL